MTLLGHSNTVNVLLKYKDKLVSGSADRSVIFWDMQTGTKIVTIPHKENVYVMTVCNNFLFTGCDDHTIRMWNEVPLWLCKIDLGRAALWFVNFLVMSTG